MTAACPSSSYNKAEQQHRAQSQRSNVATSRNSGNRLWTLSLIVLSAIFFHTVDSYVSQVPGGQWSWSSNSNIPTKLQALAKDVDSTKELVMAKIDYSIPAIDRYVRLPDSFVPSSRSSSSDSYFEMKARGPAPSGPEPFGLVGDDIKPLSDFVKEMVQSENPVLTMAASHFFDQRQGKRFRPTIVAIMGRALAPSLSEYMGSKRMGLQLQLGQITEMIHVASLIHDDVLDEADMRRGGKAVHTMYTNKVAVLAGDYLLARASVLLARLRHFQVVEVMATALDALVQGEIMQARSKREDTLDLNYYLRKSYFKTASLICASCKSCALLSGFEDEDDVTAAAEEYGYHLGMAYQIVDDILDFTGASATLGKPAQADMELGLATAPVLYALAEDKSLKPLIERKFKEKGDVQKAVEIASKTDCINKSFELADFHAQRASDACMRLPPSEARDALMKILHLSICRDK